MDCLNRVGHLVLTRRRMKLLLAVEVGHADGVESELDRKILRTNPSDGAWRRIESVDASTELLDQAKIEGDVVADAKRIDNALWPQRIGMNPPTPVIGDVPLSPDGDLLAQEEVPPDA